MPRSRRIAFRLSALAVLVMALSSCARRRVELAPATTDGEGRGIPSLVESASGPLRWCAGCVADDAEDEVVRAVAMRVADLEARGGECQAYAVVLASSLAGKRILVRPFMWRVSGRLASAQALSTGEIDVARDVDPLNVGRRSLDEVVQSVEHEAVHIAFAIPSGPGWNEVRVDERVERCRAPRAVVRATP